MLRRGGVDVKTGFFLTHYFEKHINVMEAAQKG
jgi:hypothetical protein